MRHLLLVDSLNLYIFTDKTTEKNSNEKSTCTTGIENNKSGNTNVEHLEVKSINKLKYPKNAHVKVLVIFK